MKKIAVALLCLCVFGIDGFAQSGRTRQRIVVTENKPNSPVSAPTTQQPNPTTPSTTSAPSTNGKRPPVLTGNTLPPSTAKPAPSASPAGSSDDLGVVEDDEVIKVETNLVTLPVAVLDRNGRFISGLQQNDFQIYEDGVQQKVEYFASLENPFTVVLLIDVSNSTAFKIEEIQDAAISFINQLRPEDRVMVISFDESVHALTPQPTNNRAQLQNAVRRLNFGGGTSLYEAVDQAIKRELTRIEGRKAIVLFTDGVDTTSNKASYQSNVRDAEEIDAMIYPIRFDTYTDMNGGYGRGGNYPMPPRRRRGGGGGWGNILGDILSGGNVTIGGGGYPRGGGGGGAGSGDYAEGKRYLEDLARVSGGRNFEASNAYNLDAAFSGIAEELRRQYSIGYYPENVGQQGQRKQVSVRVKQTNAVVRAKNSYIVGNNGTVAQQKPKAAPTVKTNGRLPF